MTNTINKRICTNCNKPMGKIGTMMPTLNKKHREMCMSCTKKVLKQNDI